MRYIVDSNSFITPHRGYSPIDVARSLWSKISSLASEHKIYSLDKVKEELYLHDDELKEWMKADIYLVAFAAVAPEEWAIVSMERPAPRNAGEIKLPDACAKFCVRCLMLQDMFREMGESY